MPLNNHSSKPTLSGMPAALFLAGLGLSLYYGHAWWQLPHYSEADIQQSVELNLAMDLQHLPASARAEPARQQRRETIEVELREVIRREREETRTACLAGLAALLASLAQMAWLRRRHRSTG